MENCHRYRSDWNQIMKQIITENIQEYNNNKKNLEIINENGEKNHHSSKY